MMERRQDTNSAAASVWSRGMQRARVVALASGAWFAISSCEGGASQPEASTNGENSAPSNADPSQTPEPSPEGTPDDPSDAPKSPKNPDPSEESPSEDGPSEESPSEESPSEESPDASGSTSSGDSDPEPDPGTGSGGSDSSDSTSTDSSSDSDSTEDPDDPGGGKPNRDCDKISWGSSNIIKVGDILQRGDTPGYVDTNGDNKPEEVRQTAGMCELHLTGRKCGLVLYGAD